MAHNVQFVLGLEGADSTQRGFSEAVVCAVVVVDCIILQGVSVSSLRQPDSLFVSPIILFLKERTLQKNYRELDCATHVIILGKRKLK